MMLFFEVGVDRSLSAAVGIGLWLWLKIELWLLVLDCVNGIGRHCCELGEQHRSN